MAAPRLEWASTSAEQFLEEEGHLSLPVDPMAIAEAKGVLVQAKDAASSGVPGMLVRHGNEFAICYATHIESEGFQRFSVGHELGHYLLPGHIDHLFRGGQQVHESRSGFISSDQYEQEADQFSVGLLMPKGPFTRAMDKAGEGLDAVESLATLCRTSLTSTAIRYAQLTPEAVAVVMSSRGKIEYCFMSGPFRQLVTGAPWLKKGQPVPPNTVSRSYNGDAERILRSSRVAEQSHVHDWFGEGPNVELVEEVVGLGKYGKVLTVLSAAIEEVPDEDEEDDDDEW